MQNDTGSTICLDESSPAYFNGLFRRGELARQNSRTSVRPTYDSSDRSQEPSPTTSGWQPMRELPQAVDFGGALAIINVIMPDSAYTIVNSLAENVGRVREWCSTRLRETESAPASDDLFATFGNVAVELEWRAQNERRLDLIHKRIAKTLALRESQELHGLQQLADRRQQEKSPRDTSLLDDLEKALGIDDDTNNGD